MSGSGRKVKGLDSRRTLTAGRQAHGRRASAASTTQKRLPQLRAPIQVTLEWRGGSEPWVYLRCGDDELWVPPRTTVWEVVLRLKGWA